MSDLEHVIDTYLTAYTEPEATRRRQLITEVWSPAGSLTDPPLAAAGHDAIDEMAQAVQAQFPGTRFRRTTGVDAHHGYARYGWELVGADGSVVLTGMDVAHVDDGRLAAVVGFFGDLPAA